MQRFLLFAVALLCAGFALAATNINTATKAQLTLLPGIDATKAQAVIDYRTAKGDFKKIDDIKNVKGIDAATFDKIKGEIAVSGNTTPPTSSTPMSAPTKAEPAKAEPAKAEPASTTGK